MEDNLHTLGYKSLFSNLFNDLSNPSVGFTAEFAGNFSGNSHEINNTLLPKDNNPVVVLQPIPTPDDEEQSPYVLIDKDYVPDGVSEAIFTTKDKSTSIRKQIKSHRGLVFVLDDDHKPMNYKQMYVLLGVENITAIHVSFR